jgi:sugar/nucleoside kinase (ribokinase family)
MSLLVVGSVALDTVKTPFGQVKEALGGSAVYASVAASFFTKVNLVAVVGEDFPKEHLRFLSRRGIDLRGLEIKKGGATFRWEGEYDKDPNQAKTLKTELNVFQEFKPTLPKDYRKSKFVFLANIDPDLQVYILKRIQHPKLVACDTMNHWISAKRRALQKAIKKVDIFLSNDAEARQFTGEPNLIKAANKIVSWGPRLAIIKKGEHGALLFSRIFKFLIPAFMVENCVDPTGAGDSFAGGFMGYLANCSRLSQTNFKKALVYGSVLASFNVEDFSLSSLRRLKKHDIAKRMKLFQRLTSI